MSNISYCQTNLNQIFLKNGDAATAFMCAAIYFFTLDNYLLYMDALHKAAIYLWFTTPVFLSDSVNFVFNQTVRLFIAAARLFIQ